MLIAAIARTFAPGIKFDNICVLVGDQGIGKSSLIANLGKTWYTDGLKVSDLADPKKAAEKIQGHFIIEMSELAGMRKIEVETVKAFISAQTDNFREAYARRATHHPRQCVFFGTTNNKEGFLRDITGNRRFWIIATAGDAVEGPWSITDEYVDQVWAEAYHYYRQGESLLLPQELNETAEQAQRDAMEADERIGVVREFLDTRIPLEDTWNAKNSSERRCYFHYPEPCQSDHRFRKREYVSNIEIWMECFNKNKEDMQPKDSYVISGIMKRLTEWEKVDKPMKVSGYGLQRVYKRKSCTEVVTKAVTPVSPLCERG
jgi:predicted P-loop ATPase